MLGNVMPHYFKLQRLITKKTLRSHCKIILIVITFTQRLNFKVLIYLVATDKICRKGVTLKKVLGKVSVKA